MSNPVQEWMSRAKEDYDTARYLLKGKKLHGAAFFSQQTAEKALKAVQIYKLKKFDRIHDLVLIAQSINAPEKVITACAEINPHYTSTRYPDVKEVHDFQLVQALLKHCKEVLSWAEHQLK